MADPKNGYYLEPGYAPDVPDPTGRWREPGLAEIVQKEAGGITLPALGPTTASFTAGVSSGSLVAAITGLSSGETISSISPNDGRLAISSGSAVVVGLTASSPGTINYTLTTSAGRTLTIAVTASAASTVAPPTASWRLPISAAYDSGADATFTAAMVASGTAKTLPTFTSNAAIPASSTRTVSFKVAPVAAPGGMLFIDWIQNGSGLLGLSVFESFDSTDGTAATGTWSNNPFAMWKPSGDTQNTGFSGRGQTPRLATDTQNRERWVRCVFTVPASTTILPFFGAFQLQADGSHDLWALIGMSIDYINMPSRTARAAIQAAFPGSDPIVITTARSGADQSAIFNEQIVPLRDNPQLAGFRSAYMSTPLNNIAYKGIRPYGTNPTADAAVGTEWQTIFDTMSGIVGAARVIVPDISFANFTSGDTTSGALPYVNGDVNSLNGTLQYNQLQFAPRVKISNPTSINPAMGWFFDSDYAGDASSLEDYYPAGDSLHNTTAGATAWNERIAPLVRQIYGQAAGDDTMQSLLNQAGNPTSVAIKTRLQNIVTAMATMYPPAAGTQTTNRNAFAATVNALSTTYSDPTIGSGVLPTDASLAAYPLLARFHAGDPSKFTRDFRGVTSALIDRKNGYAMAQAAYNQRPRLRAGLGALKARLDFSLGTASPIDARSGTFMASTDAALVGALDAGAVPFTLFFVIAPSILPPNGGDVFCIGSATYNIVLVGLQTNSNVPRVLIGDATGSAYSLTPSDPALLAAGVGATYAFAIRRDAAGNLKYYRGNVTGTGTTAKNAAVTGSSARIATRVQGGGSVNFTGGFHEALIYQGVMTDAEVGSVLSGLQSAWGAI